jgi:hypothetical protein
MLSSQHPQVETLLYHTISPDEFWTAFPEIPPISNIQATSADTSMPPQLTLHNPNLTSDTLSPDEFWSQNPDISPITPIPEDDLHPDIPASDQQHSDINSSTSDKEFEQNYQRQVPDTVGLPLLALAPLEPLFTAFSAMNLDSPMTSPGMAKHAINSNLV